MRRIHVAVTVAAAVLLSLSCSDRTPTAPSSVAQVQQRKQAEASAPGTCVSPVTLLAEADTVFGKKSPNANSARGKIDLIVKAVAKGDIRQAQDHAFKTVAFILQQARDKKGVAGTTEQVASLTNHIFCYAGLAIAISDPQNSVVVEPAPTTQVVTNTEASAGVSLPPNSLTETTVLEFVRIPDTFGGNGRGPLLTKLDQYAGFFAINASSATGDPLATPVVVGVCPVPGIDPVVRQRLRLGHQAQPDSAHFVITPAADASFLQCPTQTAAIDRLPGWLRSVATLVLPKSLHARQLMAFSGGVGGTAGEFSPFGPVDYQLEFSGGVGGTAGEFMLSPPSETLKKEPAPSRLAQPKAKTLPKLKRSLASRRSLLDSSGACLAIDAPWGTPVDPACRPTITIKTHLGTPLAGVPVSWKVSLGNGKVASPDAGPCGAYGDSVLTATDTGGKARACWTLGDTVGTNNNQVIARPYPGGDAPVGVTFVPPSALFTGSALKRPSAVLITCYDSIYNGADRNPCGALVTDSVDHTVIGTVPVTYAPSIPHDTGTYTATASYAGSARYLGGTAVPKTVQIFSDFISAPRNFAVGETSVCAISSTSAMYCWGDNYNFQLGVGDTTVHPSSPFAPAGLQHGFVQLSYGNGQFFCGIQASRAAECWGRGTFGQLGGGTVGSVRNLPASVAGGVSWANIFGGRLSSCGVSTSGVGYCWGSNQRGEVGIASVILGTSAITMTTVPAPVDGGLTFKSVVAGWIHACGITTSGAAYCWGDNRRGQLGLGVSDTSAHRSPEPVAGGLQFVQLSLGATYTCGITVNHQAYCWGENFTGQLGDSTTTRRASPTPVAGGHHFAYIAAGSGFNGGIFPPASPQGGVSHTCALTESGAPYCWGLNSSGQLGDGTTTDHSYPVPVSGSLHVTSLGLGGASACGRRGNAIWCWGGNSFGQLGNGTTTGSSVPVPVLSPFNVP